MGDGSRPDFIEDRVARNVESTLHAGGRRKGSMALYNLFRAYSGICFNVIYILCVVRQQLPLVL